MTPREIKRQSWSSKSWGGDHDSDLVDTAELSGNVKKAVVFTGSWFRRENPAGDGTVKYYPNEKAVDEKSGGLDFNMPRASRRAFQEIRVEQGGRKIQNHDVSRVKVLRVLGRCDWKIWSLKILIWFSNVGVMSDLGKYKSETGMVAKKKQIEEWRMS